MIQPKTEDPTNFENPGFKCQTCEKLFKRESHLNQHMKVHDNKQWECDVCKKTFTTKYFLKKHKRLHTGLCHIQTRWRCGHYESRVLCAVHVIFEVFKLASNIEIRIELWVLIYFLLFCLGKFIRKLNYKLVIKTGQSIRRYKYVNQF